MVKLFPVFGLLVARVPFTYMVGVPVTVTGAIVVSVFTVGCWLNCAPPVTYADVPGSNSVNRPLLSPATVTFHDDRFDCTFRSSSGEVPPKTLAGPPEN